MKHNSFGRKLWLYFALFAAVLLTALWLMQIVFLRSFYESMKTADVKRIAETIVAEYGSDDFAETLGALTFRNAVLVVIRDVNGDIVHFSDEHDWQDRPNPNWGGGADNMRPSGGSPPRGRSLNYNVALPDGGMATISTPMEPLNATTDILRTQLVYVTFAALLLSFVLAFFIARKFSRPVAAITEQAARPAKGEFDLQLEKGFCAELDSLADTIKETAAELSKAETLRRELLANISHDLRTPLTMIKAYAELIRDISGEDKVKRDAALAVISRESDRLISLVNDILDFSVLQSGSERMKPATFNLSDTARRVLSHWRPLCDADGIALTANIEPDRYVYADEARITQVMYNFMANAAAHAGEARRINMALTDVGGGSRFAVSDHGEGIDAYELPLIWDRYYKSTRGGGAGLGLAIAKEILTAHNA
ncbi:MAG: HAMP domain-containing histidine kinase, partial [Oscillospiraceae bacterium]|nr:HAMP domain-containing histidine kinase [Oscillospiraceae bacterium]